MLATAAPATAAAGAWLVDVVLVVVEGAVTVSVLTTVFVCVGAVTVVVGAGVVTVVVFAGSVTTLVELVGAEVVVDFVVVAASVAFACVEGCSLLAVVAVGAAPVLA